MTKLRAGKTRPTKEEAARPDARRASTRPPPGHRRLTICHLFPATPCLYRRRRRDSALHFLLRALGGSEIVGFPHPPPRIGPGKGKGRAMGRLSRGTFRARMLRMWSRYACEPLEQRCPRRVATQSRRVDVPRSTYSAERLESRVLLASAVTGVSSPLDNFRFIFGNDVPFFRPRRPRLTPPTVGQSNGIARSSYAMPQPTFFDKFANSL
jgi:hypothetical protein